MLEPDSRSLYTSAVTPPPGFVLDQALATTYSLDPDTLLSLPVHMALAERSSTREADPIKLLESLRRISRKFTVFVDHTGIKPPSREKVLFGMLESMLVPVRAPKGGVFHPKIWVLRFIKPGADEPALIRLLILSRNITFDRSWDISLQLDGRPGRKVISANEQLGNLISDLPSFGIYPVEEENKGSIKLLAREVKRTIWEMPEKFESVAFHVPGRHGKTWVPEKSERMLIISPFLTKEALEWLGKQTGKIEAVISRPDELDLFPPGFFKLAEKWFNLNEAAETEDGEEQEARDTHGLHAKAYWTEQGWWTRLYLGSANATSAALLRHDNIEIIAELTGKKSLVGSIDKFLGRNGLGDLLSEYSSPEEPLPESDDKKDAKRKLEQCARELAKSEIKVVCRPDENSWSVELSFTETPVLRELARLRAWPITVSSDRAAEIVFTGSSGNVLLGRYSIESITGLIAFELTGKIRGTSLKLVLNLPVEGVSSREREDAIFRLVLDNQDGFLKYLLLLLGEEAGNLFSQPGNPFGGNGRGAWMKALGENAPILEELTRCFSRHPEKLKDIKSVVERLRIEDQEKPVIPAAFLGLWKVFEEAMKEADR